MNLAAVLMRHDSSSGGRRGASFVYLSDGERGVQCEAVSFVALLSRPRSPLTLLNQARFERE
jgi:hypothetical protein